MNSVLPVTGVDRSEIWNAVKGVIPCYSAVMADWSADCWATVRAYSVLTSLTGAVNYTNKLTVSS